jgi:hypothetical protein
MQFKPGFILIISGLLAASRELSSVLELSACQRGIIRTAGNVDSA